MSPQIPELHSATLWFIWFADLLGGASDGELILIPFITVKQQLR